MNTEDTHNKKPPAQAFPGTRFPKYQDGLWRSNDEKKEQTYIRDEFDPNKRDVVFEAIKQLIREGNVHRILIQDDEGNTLHQVSLTSGVLGAVLFPSIASLIGLAAMAGKRKIVVERVHIPKK